MLEEQKKAITEKAKYRIIQSGGGRKPKLSVTEQILLTLVYLHHLQTFQMLGVQFGVSESTGGGASPAPQYITYFITGLKF